MRMWKVDPAKMCRKHLLGEHVEMHMFAGSVNKGISVVGYIDRGLVDMGALHRRHYELVEEMRKRGYNHQSILPDFEWGPHLQGDRIDVEANEKELKRRCKECKF